MFMILAGFQTNLHWHPLHDFHVVSGRIFRRKQAESGSGGRGKAIDVRIVFMAAAIGVDLDLNLFAQRAFCEAASL